MPFAAFTQALSAHRLIDLGRVPDDESTLILIGPDEPGFWDHFTQSPEYKDAQDNPLDRWSQRILEDIAQRFHGEAVFPFGGPPYHPFYTWALHTNRFYASPIGFLVHDTRGLFASFRGAIRLPAAYPAAHGQDPCPACPAPCKGACPVDAFAEGYDVAACKTHINSPEGADCIAQGCRARRACPIYQGNRLPAQAQHHMKAFQ